MLGIMSVRRTLFGSYAVGADEIARLHERLKFLTKRNPTWEISLRGGLTFTSENPQILVNDPALGSGNVRLISARASGTELDVSVEFNTGSSPVQVRISGADRRSVMACDSDLVHLILNSRVWWSFLRAPFGRSHDSALILQTFIGLCGLASVALGSFWFWQGTQVSPTIAWGNTAFQLFALSIMLTPSMIFRFDRGGRYWTVFAGVLKYFVGVVFAGLLINWVSSIWNPLVR